MSNAIHVAVAVILNSSNKVCISLRHNNAHQGGLWEFPGGKVESNETVEQALVREIKEELGLDVQQSRRLITVWHDYKDIKVCLQVFKVLSYQGEAYSVEGQQIKWVDILSLTEFDFPAANLPIIKALQIPDRYLITGKFIDLEDFRNKLQKALELNSDGKGIELVQLRLKNDSLKDIAQTQTQIQTEIQAILNTASEICKQASVKLMLNLSAENLNVAELSAIDFSGFHADSKTLNTLTPEDHSKYPAGKLFSASCHSAEELEKAVQLKADFVVLSPVQKTASHPELDAMGWQKFSDMVEKVPMPVFALGGVAEKDLETAWSYGGQGIAAISAFWNK